MHNRRFMNKVLAVMLAAATAFTSALPASVYAAEAWETTEEGVSAAVETTSDASTEESAAEAATEGEDYNDDDSNTSEEAGHAATEEDLPAEEAESGETLTDAAVPEEEPSDDADEIREADDQGAGIEPEAIEQETGAETEDGEKEQAQKHHFRISFDEGAGTVRVILSSDGGANKEDPSVRIIKKEGDKAETSARNQEVKEAMADVSGGNGPALDISLEEGERVTVICEAAQGYHAERYSVTIDGGSKKVLDANADSQEYVYALTIGDRDVLFEAKTVKDSGAPLRLRAASGEPNWTKGGDGGGLTEVPFQLKMDGVKWYKYADRGYGSWSTCSYDVKMDGQTAVGYAFCFDPRKDGNGLNTHTSHKAYRTSAPMIIKALYYGQNGPGQSQGIDKVVTGDFGAKNIVTHVAVSEIYARLNLSRKSSAGDGFISTSDKLQEDVKSFVRLIEGKSVPQNYTAYVLDFNDASKQDFGFGAAPIRTGTVKLKKGSLRSATADLPKYYSMAGAAFTVYTNSGCTTVARDVRGEKAVLVTDKEGNSQTLELNYGHYWVKETDAPMGFEKNEDVLDFTLSASDDSAALSLKDKPRVMKLYVVKYDRNDHSKKLPNARFGVYTDKACTKIAKTYSLKDAYLTTNADGQSDDIELLLGDYWVKELVPPAGYALDPEPQEVSNPNPGGRYHRNFYDEQEGVYLQVRKTFSDPALTAGNNCYSYAGARFNVYKGSTNSAAVATLTTNAQGVTEVKRVGEPGTYYVKEIQAPPGYKPDPAVMGPYTLSTNNAKQTAPFVVTEANSPLRDPVRLQITKKNAAAGDDDLINKLTGTLFEVKYYAGLYTASTLPASAARTWVLKTNEENVNDKTVFRCGLSDKYFVSGDSFYRNPNGEVVLPLGTFTITEKQAAPGYLNDGTFGDGQKTFICQIIENADRTGTERRVIQGRPGLVTNTEIGFDILESPKVPEIGTSARDKNSGTQVSMANGEVTIVDTVDYRNLVAGEEYVMKGRLIDKATGKTLLDKDKKEVTAETAFTAADTTDADGNYTGSVDVTFTFRADESFKDKTVVAYEYVFKGDAQLIVKDENGNDVEIAHEDMDDEGQTIHFPQVSTSILDDASHTRNVLAGGLQNVTDTVSYRNLVPGIEYEVKGELRDKATGEPVLAGGEKITGSTRFTPDKAEGTVDVHFSFDTTGMEGRQIVSFEELYVNGRLVGEHKDINDKEQTLLIPGVMTDAADSETGDKNTLAADEQILVDKVSFENLIAGTKYTVTGELKRKPVGMPDDMVFDDAETVPSTIVDAESDCGIVSFDGMGVTFTPAGEKGEAVTGEIYISFRFDASLLRNEDVVVGETVKTDWGDVAIHRDLRDDRQNSHIPDGRTLALDSKTGIKNVLAEEKSVIVDTFHYENLIPGRKYIITGDVMQKVTGDKEKEEGGSTTDARSVSAVMVDRDGKPVRDGCFELIPEEADGEIDLYFLVDTGTLENRDLVVYETVTLNGAPVIIHEDIEDAAQTTYVPQGHTTAIDSETGDQLSLADGEVTVIDRFEYRNLIPGTEYTITGRVMRKSDVAEIPARITGAEFVRKEVPSGEETPVESGVSTPAGESGGTPAEEGENAPAEAGDGGESEDSETGSEAIRFDETTVTFTPDAEDGSIDIRFTFDGSQLMGQDVVVYERALYDHVPVIIHENINDEGQTVHIGGGRTTAGDRETGSRTMMAQEDTVIKDVFRYENLLPGREYSITGKVMLKPEGNEEPTQLQAQMVDAEGNSIEAWTFTAAGKNGSETLYFKVNSADLAGRSAVLFEKVEYKRVDVIVHEDIHDEDQTIHFPDGGTTATDSETKDHIANADEEVTINDEVRYHNLIPGSTYTVKGKLMDKRKGEPVTVNGKAVTGQTTFTPEAADGSVIVAFSFDASALGDASTVAFETVESEGRPVFVHEEIENEDQSVDFPSLRTKAKDGRDGDSLIAPAGSVTVVDEVTYTNLIPGKKYVLKGVLMSKQTGNPAMAGGREITGMTTFTAEEKNGSRDVTFRFNASDLREGDYVVFEQLFEMSAKAGGQVLVGSHADLDDKAQTVHRPATPAGKVPPRTGDKSMAALFIAAAAASAAGVIAVLRRRRRQRNTGK